MIEQGSSEWLQQRSGKFCGSKFIEIMKRAKKPPHAPLKGWHDCIWQIVSERLSGTYKEGISAAALQWGSDCEAYAREAYEIATGNIVKDTGFIIHPEYSFIGASPDGLIDEDGTLEMKCPKDSAIHLERFISGMEDSHLPQTQGALWVTGRKWTDFYSYDPRMPEKQRGFLFTVERDDSYISLLEESILEAQDEAIKKLAQILEATQENK